MIKNRAEFKGWFIFVLITYQIIRNFGIFSQQFFAENKPTFKFGTGMRGAIRIFCLICGIFSALPVYAADIPAARELLSSIDISNSDNIAPEILAAYQALEQSVQDAENLNRQYQADLQENADAMHETEQSLENRMLGGAAMATTGIGAMQLGAAMAEQSADAAAQRDMSAYLATFRCDYGAGANIQGGETNITLPGANTLLTLRTEYMDLAADIKIRKESLGLPPGIESETILDATQHNLYNNESIGITDGAYASVSRALTNTGGDDATEWAAMKSETAEQLKSGAIAAGIGAVGSAVANMVINKDAPQERSREITNEYNNKLQTIESEIDEKQNALLTAINENEQRIAEYNELLNQHNEFIATITPECMEQFSDYIAFINNLEPITDEMANTASLPVIEYDLDELRAQLNQCISSHQQMIDEFNSLLNQHLDFIKNMDNAECREKMNDYITYISGLSELDYTATEIPDLSHYDLETQKTSYQKCVDDAIVAAQEELQQQIDECNNRGDGYEWQDGECVDTLLCPSENPRFRGAAGKRVGDSCSYGNVAVGHIFKFESGTKRYGVDVGGTCSCSADECKTGYKLSGGMCTECDDGYKKDDSGNCVLNTEKPTADTTLQKCPYQEYSLAYNNDTVEECIQFCKDRAQQENCEYDGAGLTNGKCRCSPGQSGTSIKYYAVCGDDAKKTGGTEICEEDFFKDKRLQPTSAIALAQEFARIKYGDSGISCNDTPRSTGSIISKHDYLQCASADNKRFYEFRFKKIDATGDKNIEHSIKESICALYGTEFVKSGIVPPRTNGVGIVIDPGYSWPDYCATNNTDTCGKIAETGAKFGYTSDIAKGKEHKAVCAFNNAVTRSRAEQQSLAANIDIRHFYTMQTYLNDDLVRQICTYVENAIKPTKLESCECNAASVPVKEDGLNGSLGVTDDVLTCHINGEPISFIFDALSEGKGYNLKSAKQQMDCIVIGGTYDGKHCINLDQKQCDTLRNTNLKNCPECKTVKWNPTEEICELPSSEHATNLQRGLEITGQVAGIVGAAALSIVTAGTGTVAVVLVGIEAVGGTMAVVAVEKQYQAAYDFLTESNKCHDASCAEKMIKENLQRLANLQNNFTQEQLNAIDSELERLINLLPNETIEKIAAEFNNNLSLSDNKLSFWDADSWEPEDVWETVGNVLSVTTVVASIGKGVINGLTRSSRALANRVGNVAARNADDVALTLTRAQAKRLDDLNIQEEQLLARQRANPSASEAEDIRRQLITVRQERQTLLNQLGNPSDEALDAAKAEAYRLDELQTAQTELERLQQHRAGLYTTNRNGQQVLRQGATRYDVQDVDRQIAQQQQRIRELGGDVPGATTTPASAATNAADAAPSSTSAPTAATNNADDAARATGSVADDAANAADDAARVADDADKIVATPVDETAENAANSADDAARATASATDDTNAAARGAVNTSKAARLAAAKQAGRAGYHGTNVNLADDVMLLPSKASETTDAGVSITKDIETARNYGIIRSVRAQNPDMGYDKFLYQDGVLNIFTDRPLNLNNKSIYIYELEIDPNASAAHKYSSHAGSFFAYYNQNATEWLAKTEENLDDLIASGRVRMIPTNAADDAVDAARAGVRGSGGAANAVRSADDMLNDPEFTKALNDFQTYGYSKRMLRSEMTDAGWEELNKLLEPDGIIIKPSEGYEFAFMEFDFISDGPARIKYLRNQISMNFDTYISDLKNTGSSNARFSYGTLTDDEWDIVNNSLYDDGIRLRYDGRNSMIMEEIPDHPATIARQNVRRSVDNILTNFERVTYRNTQAYVYQPNGLGRGSAKVMADNIMKNSNGEIYAVILNKTGYENSDYMVIAMSKSDAEKMGYVWNGEALTSPIDNSGNMARLQQQIGKRLTSIHRTPVVIESVSDFGAVDGRAIVMVKVGNKKLPFYISTGSAGKTGVPTGKWEFFGGITSDGYFRKLDIKSINAHYNSAELRQIANALDNNIGDLRDTELVLETIGRQELGGSGNVAGLYNAQTISRETVNQSFNPEHVKEWDLLAFGEDINEIRNYLRNL